MVELIPRRPAETPLWQQVLFNAATALAILSLSSFLLFAGLKGRSALTLEELTKQLNQPPKPEELQQEKSLLWQQRQITAWANLSEQQKPVSRVLALLEKVVHPQVVFSKTNFSSKDDKVWVSGTADNFRVLAEQTLLFKAATGWRNANLVDANLSKSGGIDFSFEIALDPAIFKFSETSQP